jgi:hypothetical protein
MLNALKKLFGIKAKEAAEAAPYKVEAPTAKATPAKKPAVKKAITKPRKPRAPKA